MLASSEEKFSKAFHASPGSVNINRLSDGLYLAVNEGFTWSASPLLRRFHTLVTAVR